MLRRFTKRWFGIKNKHQAAHVKQRFALIYALVGWNCFGVILYVLLKDKMPSDPAERRMSFSKLTGVPNNMHVYQVTGLNITKEFDIAYKAKVTEEERKIAEKEQAANSNQELGNT